MRSEIHGYKGIAKHTTQRKRLAWADRKQLTRAEARDVIHDVAPNIEVVFRGGEYHHGFYRNPSKRHPGGQIHFTTVNGTINLGTVLHELAHHLHWLLDKDVRSAKSTADRRRLWHGPGFVAILDMLVWGWYLPKETS